MSFGHQSDVHKHLFAKRPLFLHRMVNDTVYTKIVAPVQDEGLRLRFVLEDIESRLEILIQNAHVLVPFMSHRLKSF